jgi:hypothetical protein
MIRYWQWLSERETMVAHRDIEDSEMLTCHQIGLDRQSHYAHEGVVAEVAPILESCQLWDRRKTVSFE